MARLVVCVLVSALTFTGYANATPRERDVVLNLSEVFVPSEAKADGKHYVVLSGMFPNSCYRWKGAEVRDVSQTQHVIRAIATVTETMCLMVLVPYSKEVVLGRLASGEHTLKFMNGDETYFERTLVVP